MKKSSTLLFALALAASSAALAQYAWIDKEGRRVFSDQPPPADVPASNVLSQPRRGDAVVRAEAEAPEAPASSPVVSVPAGVDQALEAKKKQAEAEEAAKQKAEEQRQAAARADNCQRAKTAKATLDSGMRLARVNSNGEHEILDDDQRAAETSRLQKIIASECK